MVIVITSALDETTWFKRLFLRAVVIIDIGVWELVHDIQESTSLAPKGHLLSYKKDRVRFESAVMTNIL